MYRTLLYTILGYLSGSLLFAKFFNRLLDGEDVTAESPDKNPGVYNAFLYGGKFCGILTLCCDLLKGFFPVYLYSRAPDLPLFPAGNGPAIPVVSGGGLALVLAAPVLGHIFPLWHRFRGGKGITVTFGVLLGLLPQAGPVVILACVFLFFLSGRKNYAQLPPDAFYLSGLRCPHGGVFPRNSCFCGFLDHHGGGGCKAPFRLRNSRKM